MPEFTGGINSETLTGSASNDVLIGYAGNDILVGNGGNDIFVLGYKQDVHYLGNDYATIQDFSTGDKIFVGGNLNNYRFGYEISTNPYSINTTIYYGNNLIAYVKGGAGLTFEDLLVVNSNGSITSAATPLGGVPDSVLAAYDASRYALA